MKKRKKKTPEEREAERAYQANLDRRLTDKIERLRAASARKGTLIEGDLDTRFRHMIERYRQLSARKRATGEA